MLTTDGLIQLSADGRVEPRLAREWRWENNGLRLRVALEPGIAFHDGRSASAPVIAEILAAAVERGNNRALYPSFNSILGVSADGPDQIIFDLASPSAFLPEDLEIPIEIGSPPQSTGAFRVVRQSSSEIVLRGFEDYRGGKPIVDDVIIQAIPSLRTAWTNLLRGDVDMVADVPPDAVEFITNDQIRVVSFSRRYQYLIAFNQARSSLASPLVRRALNLAVDRDALIARVLKDRGTASTGPLWPQYWAYDQELAPFTFDPAEAETLLERAGLRRDAVPAGPQGPAARLRFTCLIPANFMVWERIALEIQKSLYAVGVDMQLEVVPFDQFDTRIRQGAFDAAVIDMISGPTPGRAYIFWRSARVSKGLNVFGYENREAERLFETLRTSGNEAVTRAATRRLQRVFLEDPPALFLAWNERARAVRRDFVIPDEGQRDPLLTLWRWSPLNLRIAAAK